MQLLSEMHNLETTPCLGGYASVLSCLPSAVLLFSCNATTGRASISLLALGGRGRAAYSGTVFVEMHRHSGVVIPPLLQQCPLGAQFARAATSGGVLSEFFCLSQK